MWTGPFPRRARASAIKGGHGGLTDHGYDTILNANTIWGQLERTEPFNADVLPTR